MVCMAPYPGILLGEATWKIQRPLSVWSGVPCLLIPASDVVQNGMFGNAPIATEKTAQIGISVEPFDQVKALTPADGSSTTAAPTDAFMEFGKKMLENFVDFASSFAVQPNAGTMSANETYVPLSVLQKWYDNFTRRLSTNPYFWRS